MVPGHNVRFVYSTVLLPVYCPWAPIGAHEKKRMLTPRATRGVPEAVTTAARAVASGGGAAFPYPIQLWRGGVRGVLRARRFPAPH